MKGKPWTEARRLAQNKVIRKNGFTILELLVVILIMMVLASILFPVLATVKGKSQQIKCMSNLRQLGMAISMYAGDHDDMLPLGGYDNLVTLPDGKILIERLQWEDELLGEYIKNIDIFVCPVASVNDYRYSYGSNRWTMGWKWAAKLPLIPDPSKTVLVTEKAGTDWPAWSPDESRNNAWYTPLNYRHSGKLNVLFCDSHITTANINQIVADPSKRIVWNWNQEVMK